jgi:mannosyltransferase
MKPKTFWLIFTIGAALRIFWISVPPLWYDENFTLMLSRLPFAQMMQATTTDVHPPLWYIIEWIWMHIYTGDSVWMIRVPALICSLLSMLYFAELLNDLHIPERVQIAAVTLMAILPFQLWYAQEGRMYSMLELEVILALLFTLRRNWAGLFIVSVAMLYTQNYAMFYLPSIWLVSLFMQLEIAFWMRGALPLDKDLVKSQLVPAIITAAVMIAALVAYLPWMKVIFDQMQQIDDRYWIVAQGAGSVLIILYKLFMTAAVPGPFFFASYFVTFAAVVIGFYHFIRSDHPARLTIGLMALAPIALASMVSFVWQPVLLFRALIGVSPFLYIIVSWPASAFYPVRDVIQPDAV